MSFVLTVAAFDCSNVIMEDFTINDMIGKITFPPETQSLSISDSGSTFTLQENYCGTYNFVFVPDLAFLVLSVDKKTLTLDSSNPADTSNQ